MARLGEITNKIGYSSPRDTKEKAYLVDLILYQRKHIMAFKLLATF
jgi:hypothetical protein